MMRKVLYLLTLLGLFATQSKAQYTVPYTPASMYGIPQAVSPQNNVTVTPINPPLYSNQSACGVGPHLVGGLKSDGYNYSFSQGATKIQMEFADLHDNDSVRISINGSQYILTGANLTNSPTCANPNTAIATAAGELSSSGTPVGPGTAVLIDINPTPTMINTLSILHVRNNPNSGGVVYSLTYWEDTCDADLVTVTNNNPCTARDLLLNVTNLPNSTFSWSGPGGWTANVHNPVRPKVNILQGGQYDVTVTRGNCPPILKSTFVNLKANPGLPSVITNTSPVCKGGDVDLEAVAGGISGVTYYWYGPNGFFNSSTIDGKISLPGIQPGQEGIYYSYAESTDGCISDTASALVTLLPDVDAMFTHVVNYGCTVDTIYVNNTSTGATNGLEWYLNPIVGGVPTGPFLISTTTDPNPVFYMPFDKHNLTVQSYEFKLLAKNAACADSLSKTIDIDHQLKADFDVDDDTICQGATTINFSNKSSAATGGTTHDYFWDFKDGSPIETTYNVSHMYTLAGVYDAELIVRDYINCEDTATHTIFVDSTGAVTFTMSDDVICAGETVFFNGDYSRIGNTGTRWDFGDGNTHADTSITSYAFDTEGDIQVTFTVFNRVCPDTSAKNIVRVKPDPLLELGEDTAICPNGAPIVLIDKINIGNPNATWVWNNNTKSKEGKILVRHPGVYSATVEIDGCSTTDSITITKDCYIDLPNVFTPNGDGNGDYFLPRQFLSKGVKTFSMTVFDRWGGKVFETNAADGRGWDGNLNGEPMPQGVYVYMIKVTFMNNTSENYQGNVTLLR